MYEEYFTNEESFICDSSHVVFALCTRSPPQCVTGQQREILEFAEMKGRIVIAPARYFSNLTTLSVFITERIHEFVVQCTVRLHRFRPVHFPVILHMRPSLIPMLKITVNGRRLQFYKINIFFPLLDITTFGTIALINLLTRS